MDFIQTVAFAVTKHKGQLYGDRPYTVHLDHVYHTYNYLFGVPDTSISQVIYLHDILEDTCTTKEELLELGLPENVVNSVVALTKLSTESRHKYLNRVVVDEIALKVKIADSTANYIRSLQSENARLISKYEFNLRFLWEAYNKGDSNGTR